MCVKSEYYQYKLLYNEVNTLIHNTLLTDRVLYNR